MTATGKVLRRELRVAGVVGLFARTLILRV